MIRCDTCPRCKDEYPEKLDSDGYHFHICGMTGNMVYTEPRRVKKWSGTGYLKYGISSCGIFNTLEDVLASMTEPEIRRWREQEDGAERVSETGAADEPEGFIPGGSPAECDAWLGR